MNFNGKVLTTFNTNSGIFLGGDFTSYKDQNTNRIIYLTKFGTIEETFKIGSGFNNTVKKIYVQQNGKILVGGAFTSYNGQNRNRIIRLNEDGSIDTNFNIGTGFDDDVEFILQQPDGKILVGGAFTSYNGQNRNRIIRLNEDGSIDILFNIGSGFDDNVYKIDLIDSDNRIIIGGKFTSYNGQNRNRIVILNIDGNIDNTFNIGTGFDGDVKAIYYDNINNKIYVGGSFLFYKNVQVNKIISLQLNGNKVENFQSGTGFNDDVYDIIPAINRTSNQEILIGGKFTSYNNTPCNGLIKISSDGGIIYDPSCINLSDDNDVEISCYIEQGIVEITPGLNDINDALNNLFFEEFNSEDFSFDQESIYPGTRMIVVNKDKSDLPKDQYTIDEEFVGNLFGAMVIVGLPNSNKVNIYEITAVDRSKKDWLTGAWTVKTKYSFKKIQTIDGLPSTESKISKFGITVSYDNINGKICAIAGAFYDAETNEPESIYVKTFRGEPGFFIEAQNTLTYDLPPNLEYIGVSLAVGTYALVVGLPNLNKVIVYYLHNGVVEGELILNPAWTPSNGESYYIRPNSYGDWEVYNTYISPFLYKDIELNSDLQIYTKNMAYGWAVELLPESLKRLLSWGGDGSGNCQPEFKTINPGATVYDTFNSVILNETFPIFEQPIHFLISDPFYKEKRGMVQSFFSRLYRMRVKDGEWQALLRDIETISLRNRTLISNPTTSEGVNNKSKPFGRSNFGFCVATNNQGPGFYIRSNCSNVNLGVLKSYFVLKKTYLDPEEEKYQRWDDVKGTPYSPFRLKVEWESPAPPEIGGGFGAWTIRQGTQTCTNVNTIAETCTTTFLSPLFYSFDNVPYPWLATTWIKASNSSVDNCIKLIPNFRQFKDFDYNCFEGPFQEEELPIPNKAVRSNKDLYRGSIILDSRANILAAARNNMKYYIQPKNYYIKSWRYLFFTAEALANSLGEVPLDFLDGGFEKVRFKVSNFITNFNDNITIFDKRVWRDIALTLPDVSNFNNISKWLIWDVLGGENYNHNPSYYPEYVLQLLINNSLIEDYYNRNYLDSVYDNKFEDRLELIGIDDSYAAMAATRNWPDLDEYKTVLENNGNILVYYGPTLFNTVPIVKNWIAIALSKDGQYQTSLAWDETLNIGEIYVSNDYGSTWNQTYSGEKEWVRIDMSSSGQFQSAIAKNSKIFISHDYGQTWFEKLIELNWTGISINGRGDIQLACAVDRVYESIDYGLSWSLIVLDSASNTSSWIATALNKNKEKYNYVISLITNSNIGMFSIDNGQNLEQINFSARSPNPFLQGNCKIGSSYDSVFQTIVVENGKIFSSRNYGATWDEIIYPIVNINKQWKDVAISFNGKYQTAVANNDTIYTSNDFGTTWLAVGPVNTWKSIKMNATGEIQIAVAANNRVYKSENYGITWTIINHPLLNNNKNWADVAISSDGKYQTLVAFNEIIYTSNNFGASWSQINILESWRSVDMSLDGQFQTIVANNRSIYISRDYGETWIQKGPILNWLEVAVNDIGDIQIANTINQAYISYDYGETWDPINTNNISNFSSVFISKNKFNGLIIGNGNEEGSYDINTGWRANMQYGYNLKLYKTIREIYRSVGSIGQSDGLFEDGGVITFEKYSIENNTWKRDLPDIYGETSGDKVGLSFSLPFVGFNNTDDPKIKFVSGYEAISFAKTVNLPTINENVLVSQSSNLMGANKTNNILITLDSGNLKFYADECFNLNNYIMGCCETDDEGECWCCLTTNQCFLRFTRSLVYVSKKRCADITAGKNVQIFDPLVFKESCRPCEEIFFYPKCPGGSWEISDGTNCDYDAYNPQNQQLSSISMDTTSLNENINILSGINNVINNQLNNV
jgi:uncharacterized delta-60 repeat protein